MPKICIKRTKTGKPCKANALAGSDFCFFHDPESAEVRELGHRMGGLANRASRPETPFPECNITTDEGLIEFMKALMDDTWKLGKSVGRARALCHMADLLSDLVKVHSSIVDPAEALRRKERAEASHKEIMRGYKDRQTRHDEKEKMRGRF